MKNFIFVFFLALSFVGTARAGYEEAMHLRQAIEWTPTSQRFSLQPASTAISAPASSKILRTTRGFSQGSSQFCWVFATLNMLESNYLESHAGIDPKNIELSRWYFAMATGSTSVPGTSIDALYSYSTKIGLIANRDYEQNKIPQTTTLLEQTMTPAELREKMIDGQLFWSYAFSKTQKGWHPHRDPDALKGTLSLYVHPDKKAEIVNQSLKLGKAVTYLTAAHILTIYGADFDAKGKAIKYYVKDSYPNYFYEADPKKLLNNAVELTTVANIVKN